MKRSIFLSLFAVAVTAWAAEPAATDIHAANQRLGRGINLGNALDAPNEGEWGVTLTEEDFANVKAAGFDSVRLPTKWSNHAQATAPYTIDPAFAKRVDWCIDQATANDLNVVVNVHHYNELDADPDAHAARLVGLWMQIAERYKDRPASVYFELMNEPHEKLTEAAWNEVLPKALAAVRKSNPTRPVIVGPAQWNGIWALPKLELPEDDRNLIATVHFYEPFQFTHQGAHWVDGADAWKGKTWSGTDEEKNFITDKFDQAAAWAKEHDRPIYLGEFGAFSGADMDSRAKWTRFVVDEARRRGFSFAYWELRSGFGAFDPETGKWREPLKAALIHEGK